MKVIHFDCGFVRGRGISNSIATTLKEIRSKHDYLTLEVICNESFGLREDGFPSDVNITAKNRRKFLGYSYFSLYPDLLSLETTDETVIHIHNPILVWPLLMKKGKRVITWHGNNNQNWNDSGFGSFPRRALRKGFLDLSTYMLRKLDKVVTISDFLRNELVGYYRMPPKLTDRIYWGTDVNAFKPADSDMSYMLFVGRHVSYKNIRNLIDLAQELSLPLICAGDGVERKKLEDYAKHKGARVKFMGNIPLKELIKLYQECSFYVTASKWEGFGLPLIEAAASGKPAIAPDNSAHSEIVVDKKTGLIYRNKTELFESAKSLITDPVRRMDLGLAARAHAVERFDIRQTAELYAQVYLGI